MAYTKQTWSDLPATTTPLSAARLNHMEDGIEAAANLTWTSYTPATLNVTVGNGTLTGKYVKMNKLVIVRISFVFGSTSAFTGTPNFGLPSSFVTYAAQTYAGSGIYFNGTTRFRGMLWFGATTVTCGVEVASGTYVSHSDVSATVPFTWANNHTMTLEVIYEEA